MKEQNQDIKTVKDLESLQLDQKWSLEKRRMEYKKQMEDPYCFLCDGIEVKMQFQEKGASLEQIICQYFSSWYEL